MDPPRPPDSHDSYAATFLMLAVRYMRHTYDWNWLDEINTRFSESNLQTLLNIAQKNITDQIKTAAWCTTNGFAVDYPNGRNTLLVNTFQNGQNPAGGSYDISFTADNCECYRGLKDFGDLLADIGDPNAASILQHAENIGIAVHGLYDIVRRKWVWNDTLKSAGGFIVWFDTNPDTWQADAENLGAALYPDGFGGVFAELWAVPSTGGEQVDSLRYNDGWEFLNLTAPGWYERASYDSFPNNFYGYLAAARRRDYVKAAKALDKFLRYYINIEGPQFPDDAVLSGNTAGFTLHSEIGFAIGIQDTVTIAMAGHIEGSSYPYTPFTAKKIRALQYVEKPLRKQMLTAGTAIKPHAAFLPIGATGDVTITATPSIETTAEDGTKITLVNLDDVFVELQDESLLAGSKLRLGVPTLRLNQYEAISLQYVSAADAWIKLNNAALGSLAAGYFKALDVPGPASDTTGGYLAARALRFKQFSSIEDPFNPDTGDAGAIIYGGPDGLEIYGRNTADGLLAAIKDILLLSRLYVSAPGVDTNYNFRADGDASRDAALINGFLKIVDRLTINGDKDPDYRLRVNGDTILNGLARIISTLFLDSVGATLYLRTAADNSVLGLTAQQLRDELSVYTKAQVDSLLAGKANAGHTHGISLYTGTAGDPAHEHLVQGTTGIDQ
ncbi:MAG: hypothetical protein A3J28_15820 [Acidobacteria bacterium RIFCSPLOWO2_12_FULL_60_22]|nr:MAG: hypothetical protein A3J28_15820 [Acidobacteria bacterium RIFCSPLOWO2_12_FULL_60_22]